MFAAEQRAALSPAPQPDAAPADDVIEAAAEWLFCHDHQSDRTQRWVNCGPLGKGAYRESAREFIAAANLLRQSAPVEAKPFAWRVRDCADDWIFYRDEKTARFDAEQRGALIEPIYAHPASPPADAAGMREAIKNTIRSLMMICDGSNWPEHAQSGVGYESYTEIAEQLHEIIDNLQALPIPASPTDAAGLREQFAEIIVDEMANTKDGQGAAYDAAGRILALLPTDAAVKALEIENARLRDTLDGYACAGLGECTEPRLKDGTCIRASVGTCGHDAHATLAQHGVK